ncbi:dihydrolipoamide acetyltransferase family protein [Leucobacter luti]|uniref:Dihydrolipoamide acetyltransferase component of pyruvate dehydrogenase complex n=1 Tax=Leucobacter luti TaxID=340320 RepID=A0A4V6MDL3_9MICO|nr:dihydrolipoamide acetyltransferase family protein [Leucobacter luti]MBL3700690.1 2-oxo acid dehydrogenase subunit E2 [Leucobacter luti]RZT68469.1 pyruvate dehydrogenase E2 component (dihydrolipoamide acetyltransferase) [Leucobacter luti]
MTTQTFMLPDLGEGLTEAVLVRWIVAVGDTIATDEPIAEVETAKSIVELPSPYAGTVLALHGEEGGLILTGAPVIEVDDGAAAPGSGSAAGPSGAGSGAASGTGSGSAEHEAYRAEEQAGSGNVLIGYGTGAGPVKGRRRRVGAAGRPPERPAGAPSPAAVPVTVPAGPSALAGAAPGAAPGVGSGARRPVAVRSPIVRRLARELGVDPAGIAATGSDGAVTRGDVLRAAEAERPTLDTGAALAGAAAPTTAAAPLRVVETERFSPLRKAVSATLSRSRSEIPEATVWVDVDVTRLWELRPEMAAPGAKAPSVTALFARYVLLALQRFPLLASRIVGDGDELERYDGVNLGVAVDTERGLMVPVIPRADTLDVAGLDGALRELAETARSGRMPPERMRDSTFTVNNYGGFGVDGSAAIINTPNVAILGIGRILQRPWVVDGEIVPRRIAQLSLVFDHRVCDGGYAAGFLRAVVDLLEQPLTAYPRV